MTYQELLSGLVKSLKAGPAMCHGGLAVFPVSDGPPSPLSYILLDEALGLGTFRIGEVGPGTVPELLLENDSDSRVFLLNGEELVGARQNRILNTSLLVEARSQVKIPVSCVEQSRWQSRGAFMGKGGVSFPSMRHHNTLSVHQSLRESGTFRADQGEVWSDVAAKLSAHGVRSETHAMGEIFTQRRQSVGSYVDALPCPEGARGVVAAIGGRLACADIFDSPAVMKKLWGKLVESYALDAIELGDDIKVPSPRPEDVMAFLLLPAVAGAEPFDAPGIGKSLRLKAGEASGSALVLEETVVHLEIFPPQAADSALGIPRAHSRISRPSRRRKPQ